MFESCAGWFCSLVKEVRFSSIMLSSSLWSFDNVLLNNPSPGPDKGLFPKGTRSRQHED